jgi:hypothetical protein
MTKFLDPPEADQDEPDEWVAAVIAQGEPECRDCFGSGMTASGSLCECPAGQYEHDSAMGRVA